VGHRRDAAVTNATIFPVRVLDGEILPMGERLLSSSSDGAGGMIRITARHGSTATLGKQHAK